VEDLLAGSGPPRLGFALEIAQQSLRALGYLHTKGFLHRDISPGNLMITEDTDGQVLVKLIDLGIAKILGGGPGDGLTQTGTFLGKVRYASPEQFGVEGGSSADARGDLYSFGVVLYELLTGRYPITGRDPSSLIAGHLFRPPLGFPESDPDGRVPDGLREIVLRTLEKKPADRFASAQDLSRALAAFRVPGDVTDADLRTALSEKTAAGPGAGDLTLVSRGSTQERLNEQFGLETTPSRGRRAPSDSFSLTRETIELHLDKGELGAAETDIRRAVEAYGERPELHTLRDRLDDLREAALEQQEEERRLAAAQVEEEKRLAALRRAENERREREERAREAAKHDLPVPPPPAPPSPAIRPTPPAPQPTSAPQPPSHSRLWIVAAAVVLLIVVGIVWLLARGKPAETTVAVPAPPVATPPPPAAPVTGTLVLDAVPWGEVVEIVNAHGQKQALGDQRYTPLVVALSPGHYTVTVRNPDVPQPVKIEAEVLSGATVHGLATLKQVTEEELFHALGW
jgi:serine/threonine-protein kinase